jgi:mannose-6-phosphate isomerase
MAPIVARLDAPIRTYAWGSRTVLADLQGRPTPTSDPEAELWFGAHPSAPSRIVGADGAMALDDAITADPVGWLGPEVVARFGPQLPFLLKILAVDAPLSLQLHPSADQAEAGFAGDEAAGVPIDAPERRYRDRWPKPELVRAVTPFVALCGFRPVERTLELLDRLAVPELGELSRRLRDEGQGALTSGVAQLLSTPAAERAELVTAIARAADRGWSPDESFAAELSWLRRLADRYPQDAGVAVAVLLDLVELPPGGSVHLPAGHLHAYLHGTAVEVMAGSDNVLRGGMTAKHVDVDELLRVLVPSRRPTVARRGGRRGGARAGAPGRDAVLPAVRADPRRRRGGARPAGPPDPAGARRSRAGHRGRHERRTAARGSGGRARLRRRHDGERAGCGVPDHGRRRVR